MNTLDKLITILALCLSTTFLFQNCGAPRASKKTSTFQIQGETVNPDFDYSNFVPPMVEDSPSATETPTVLINRSFPLDNKVTFGNVNYAIGNGDTYIYETNYLATNNSTVVTIQDSPTFATFTVSSDQCSSQKNLSLQSAQDFFGLFSDAFPSTSLRALLPNEVKEEGCGFPRLILNASGSGGDVEIFFSSRECTPEGDLFLEDTNGNNQIKMAVQAYFHDLIDSACGL